MSKENVSRPTRSSARLSDPSCRYLAALYDPKTCAEPPSVPTDTQLSQKVKVFIRGALSTGTTGYGFIDVDPKGLTGNNINPGNVSTSTTVMTPATLLGLATNTASISPSNSPFNNTAFGTTAGLLQWKLVGCALYFKYAGTELNRGGDAIMIEEPAHRNLGQYSYNTAMAFDYAKRVPMVNEWQHVCFTPITNQVASTSLTDETDYSSADPSVNQSFFLGVIFNTAGASQPIDYEIYCWYEVVGATARGATMSYCDPIGFAAITGAAEAFQQLDTVVGADGLIHGVEDQLDNMSGVSRNASHVQNWAGLAAFLPQLKDIATRALSGAANGALKEFGYKKTDKSKAARKAIANLPPPPPPRRVAPQAPPPPMKTQLARARANLRRN